MQTAAIGLVGYNRNYFNKASYSARYFSGAKTANLGFAGAIICFLIIGVSVAYFSEIGKVSSLGYEMKDYEQRIEDLKTENQKIKVDMAKSISFKKIEDQSQIEKLNLVGISGYQYLAMPSSSFAKR